MTTYKATPETLAALRAEPEKVKKWADYLLSGKVEQHRSSMCSDDFTAMCCLAVGEMALSNRIKSMMLAADLPSRVWSVPVSIGGIYLEDLDFTDGVINFDFHLLDLNDAQGLTFPQIAELITTGEVTV